MDYKIVPNIEPDDPYEKAKLDVIKARESILKLPPIQQRTLAEELFGVAYVEMVIKCLIILRGEKWRLVIRSYLNY